MYSQISQPFDLMHAPSGLLQSLRGTKITSFMHMSVTVAHALRHVQLSRTKGSNQDVCRSLPVSLLLCVSLSLVARLSCGLLRFEMCPSALLLSQRHALARATYR
jgi:hypothetical protein